MGEIQQFLMKTLNRFDCNQSAFASVSRRQRDQAVKLPHTLFVDDNTIPPVGSYNPRHEAIQKSKNNTVISTNEEPRLWPDPIKDTLNRKATTLRNHTNRSIISPKNNTLTS